jgi:peptidoglycan/xylan/chitin deacetylase (PgdA/CDA1 family)
VTGGSAGRARRRTRRHLPPSHRVIIGFCMAMIVVLLLVDGLTTKTLGSSGTDSASLDAPLAGSAPILVSNGRGGLVSHQPPAGKRIALTFDDGPSATWTPRILSILERAHVTATFFEIGANAVRSPSLTRRIVRGGFELGNHTFTHTDLAALPSWERELQIDMTESAFSGIAGLRTRLVRPPYSSTPDAITPRQIAAWGQIAAEGYTIAVTNYDTRDWNQPGVGSIVAAATPAGEEGGIVMMHDGGGRRAETVAALPQIIARLERRGFRFVTVSDLAGVPRSAVMVPVSSLSCPPPVSCRDSGSSLSRSDDRGPADDRERGGHSGLVGWNARKDQPTRKQPTREETPPDGVRRRLFAQDAIYVLRRVSACASLMLWRLSSVWI